MLIIVSLAGKYYDDKSDVDLIAYCNRLPMLKEIRDLFKDDSIQKTLIPYNGFQIHLTNFEIKASIIFLNVSFIEKLVRKYPNINFGEYRELCDKLINSKVLFDKKHLISPYKNQVKKIPDTL